MPELPLEVGDRIRLNSRAREWTHGKIFTVDEVKRWGVICWARANAEDAVHVLVDSDRAFYRANWDEIDAPVRGLQP